eukprot:scaffold442_cov397-Prasinococcus_capsulatus_cf.AAC.52
MRRSNGLGLTAWLDPITEDFIPEGPIVGGPPLIPHPGNDRALRRPRPGLRSRPTWERGARRAACATLKLQAVGSVSVAAGDRRHNAGSRSTGGDPSRQQRPAQAQRPFAEAVVRRGAACDDVVQTPIRQPRWPASVLGASQVLAYLLR